MNEWASLKCAISTCMRDKSTKVTAIYLDCPIFSHRNDILQDHISMQLSVHVPMELSPTQNSDLIVEDGENEVLRWPSSTTVIFTSQPRWPLATAKSLGKRNKEDKTMDESSS